MCNILVTGSKGFIGKNLLKKLDRKKFNIIEFTRSDDLDFLEEAIGKCDFIVHLAGEVKPSSSDEDFKKANTLLTEYIINLIVKNNKKVPILMASSIHAKFLKNEYGRTKRESELLIEDYSKKYNIPCFIYRLPHVFGEGCKPNYNSVISTWIYNSIHNLEINCFDRKIEMNYVYVQDVVDEFIDIINAKIKNVGYKEPRIIYNTNLGEVIDFIDEFKLNINNDKYIYSLDNLFKKKLFITYLDYVIKSNKY